MTIEELKAKVYNAHPDPWDADRVLRLLAPEILSLVEAANKMRGQMNEVTDEVVWLEEAIDAFNAKLGKL